jgi:hypothetical protein
MRMCEDLIHLMCDFLGILPLRHTGALELGHAYNQKDKKAQFLVPVYVVICSGLASMPASRMKALANFTDTKDQLQASLEHYTNVGQDDDLQLRVRVVFEFLYDDNWQALYLLNHGLVSTGEVCARGRLRARTHAHTHTHTCSCRYESMCPARAHALTHTQVRMVGQKTQDMHSRTTACSTSRKDARKQTRTHNQ